MVIKEPRGIGNSPSRNHIGTPYAGYCRDTDNPFAPNYQGAENPFTDYYDDIDNPFAAYPSDAPCLRSKYACSFVVGVPTKDIQTVIEWVNKACRKKQAYYRQDYRDCSILVFSDIYWDEDNKAIQRLLEYLHILAASKTPIAYARLGDGIEVYTNQLGYTAYHNKIYWDSTKREFGFNDEN